MVIEPGSHINNQATSSSKSRQQPSTANVDANEKQAPTSGNASDNVSLSSASLSIGKIETALSQTDDVDHAKVAKIKAQIESGQYQIDAGAIADQINLEESQLG